MTDQEETETLAKMHAQLEAEGLSQSEPDFAKQALPSVAPALPGSAVQHPTLDSTYPDWLAQQQPASLPYLRELIQLARESGMSYIRTGNLEMRFDTDNRKSPPGGERSSF